MYYTENNHAESMQYSLPDIYNTDTDHAWDMPETVVYQVRQAVWGEPAPVVLSFVSEEARRDWVRAHDRLDVFEPVTLAGIDLWCALWETKNFLSSCDPKRIPVD